MSIETVFDNAGMDSLFFEDPFPIQFLDGNYFIDVKQAEVWGMGIDPNGDPYDEHWKIYQATLVEHSTAAGTVYNFIGQLHGDVLFEEVTGGTVCDPCLNYPYDNCCETDIERSYVQYLHLTPGDYRIRIGFVNTIGAGSTRDWTNEQWFDQFRESPGAGWEEIEITVPNHNGQPPWERSIELLNLGEYMAWLPSAALLPGDPDPGITLRFVVHSDTQDPLWMRMGMTSTQLPARWTNDYLRSYEAIPGRKRQYYQDAISVELADLFLDENAPDNSDWDFGFALDSMDVGEYTRYYSKQLAVTDEPVYSGDTLTLRVSSRDFGADGWLRGGLHEVDANDHGNIQLFSGNDLYVREIDGFYIGGLPMPRDEEIIISDYIFKGDTLHGITIGDGIGDAWEELYVDPNANVPVNEDIDDLQDSLIYMSIYQLIPENDDSEALQNIFPPYDSRWRRLDGFSAYEDTLKQAGDGLTNLEKYRGFYGVLAGNDETHIRLAPHARNYFLIQYPVHMFVWNVSLPNLSILRNTGVTRIYQLPLNDVYDENSPNRQEVPEHYKVVDGMWKFDRQYGQTIEYYPELDRIELVDFPRGAREMNTIYDVIQNHQLVVSHYQSYMGDLTDDFRAFLNGYEGNMRDIRLGFASRETEIFGRVPPSVHSCSVMFYAIDYLSKGYSYTEISPEYYEADDSTYHATREQWFEHTANHELGHFIGMSHPELVFENSTFDETIMRAKTVVSWDTIYVNNSHIVVPADLQFYDHFIQNDYRNFQLAQPAAMKGQQIP